MALAFDYKIQYGFSGLVLGGVLTMIIGFYWGGWTTSITSQTKIEEAVLGVQAEICVAQFTAHPDYEEKLKKIGEVTSRHRAGLIENGGWDKMPGQEKADFGVSQLCADGLEHLIKK
jgi:hypothetical protein